MVTQIKWAEIEDLIKQGLSVPKISKKVSISPTTIYKLVKAGGPSNKHSAAKQTPSQIEPFEKYIDRRLKEKVTNVKKILSELKDQGFEGSYATLNRYLQPKIKGLHAQHYKPSVRFETEPGDQAQVDWGSFGKIEVNGKEENLYAFVYILGYSRSTYVEFVTHQDVKTLEDCHKNAFKALGIPKTIVYDNMKTVVISREKLGDLEKIHYNPAFCDFAKFYDFAIEACPPYWPRAKGKVEAAVKYVKINFWQGLRFPKNFKTLDELNEKVQIWLKTKANRRTHQTTGDMPQVRWEEEKPYLRFPDPNREYETSPFQVRHSTKDCRVLYKHNYYSIPIEYARKKLLVKERTKNGVRYLDIYFEDQIIAQHAVSEEKGKEITKQEHLFPKLAENKKSKPVTAVKKQQVTLRPLSYYDTLIPKPKNGKK